MGLETGTYVSDLVTSNPLGPDTRSQGDDHLRLIKSVLQATFPNADKAFYFPDSITKTTNYTILVTDLGKRLIADATGGAFNLTLPTLGTSDDGWSIWILKSDSTTNAITAVGTVNGVVNPTISKQYQAQLVLWSGTAWYSVGALADPAVFVSKDAGAALGPTLDLFRDSASPAASDFGGAIDFNGRDSAANKQLYAEIVAQITDPTSTSEDAIIILRAVIAGVLTDMLKSNATGITIPGTLDVNGNLNVNTNKVTIAGATGNTLVAGTLDATGNLAVNTNKFTANATTGAVAAAGDIAGAGAILSSSAAGGVGYAPGSGGTQTQGSGSGKATTVVLNKPTGAILMNGASLAASTTVSFTLTNSTIAATDVLVLNHITTGTFGGYTLNAICSSGSAQINVHNVLGGPLAEAIVIQFSLIRGANS